MKRNPCLHCVILLVCLLLTAVVTAQTILTDTAQAVHSLQDVVVTTGQFEPASLQKSLYQVRVIDRQMIAAKGATDMLGLLNTQLGFRYANDVTLGETNVSMMGMSGQYVKVLLDGVPLINRDDANQSLAQIDINTIDHIEIVEGPMSVVYGSNAQAGVINIITKKGNGPNTLAVTARLQEETAGREYHAFTNKGVHNGNLGINWQHKGWQLAGFGTRNNFGGWQGSATGREKEWKPKAQWLTGGTIGYAGQRFNVWYRLNYLHETIDVPGKLNTNLYVAVDQYYITHRYTHMAQGNWRISNKLSFTGSASYQPYSRRTKTVRKDFLSRIDSLTTGAGEQDVSKFNLAFFRGTLQYKISDAVSLQPGVEIQSDHASGDRIAGSPTITDYAVFASAEIKPAPFLGLRPGVRFLKNSVYDAPPLVPSINSKWILGKRWDLRVSYARGFRAPALRELYFSFHDANHNIEGNPNLKAEHSGNLNFYLNWQAISKNAVQLNATLGAFYNHFNNQIDLAIDPSNPQQYRYFNKEQYKTTGATLENTFSMKNLQATVGFSYIGRFNRFNHDSSLKATSLPSFTWSPEVNTHVLYNIPSLKASVNLFYKYTGQLPVYEMDAANNNQVKLAKTAAYHWMDITVSRNILSTLVLSAGVKNMFDVTRLQSTSSGDGTHSSGGPVPMSYGRSGFMSLVFNWTKQQ